MKNIDAMRKRLMAFSTVTVLLGGATQILAHGHKVLTMMLALVVVGTGIAALVQYAKLKKAERE